MACALPAMSAANVRKVLFIGDSNAGWMAERLNAYGSENDFDVATVVWDGSTISKWAASRRLNSIISDIKPDAIFVCLGMSELFEKKPASTLKAPVEKILDAFGGKPFLWIGPPSWPGHPECENLDRWLANQLGESNYFSSLTLSLPRQSAKNPHPSKEGIIKWIDEVIEWIPGNANMKFKSLNPPEGAQMSRGRTFIYKRMQENL